MSSYATLRYYNPTVLSVGCSDNIYPCTGHTPALTSNAKYIVPGSEVYQEKVTPMMLYPGYTGFLPPPISQDLGPESIKAWDTIPHHNHLRHPHHSHYMGHGGCSTCST